MQHAGISYGAVELCVAVWSISKTASCMYLRLSGVFVTGIGNMRIGDSTSRNFVNGDYRGWRILLGLD